MDRSNEDSISLNKYISQTGVCSRREADKFIKEGQVTLNGQKAKGGNRVFKGDVVLLKGRPLISKPKSVYLAFNKPVGIVSTTDPKEKKNIVKYINHKERLFHVGRLDKESEGLIFMTNDGDIVNKILRAGNNHEKEYIVTVDKKITTDFLKKMGGGLPILNTMTKKCPVKKINDYTFNIILVQGINRQIRRMCTYLGYEVKRLIRVRIMNVNLDIPVGQYRPLTNTEMKEINRRIEDSKGFV